MKRILLFIIAFSMILSVVPAFAQTSQPEWPESSKEYVRPKDNYVTEQNPPSFTWDYVDEAESYVLEIYDSKELDNVLYTAETKHPVYNFPYTFEKGKEYYWSVKYITKDGKHSKWRPVRRFLIDESAVDFVLPPFNELLNNIPDEHPFYRVDWDRYKTLKIKDIVVKQADTYSKTEFPEMVITTSHSSNDVECWFNMSYRLYTFAMAYKMTGDKKYLDLAEAGFKHIKDWDPSVSYPYDSTSDTYEPQNVERISLAYDWLYNDMSDECKKNALAIIERMMIRPFLYWAVGIDNNGNKAYTLYKYQTSSHSWRCNALLLTSLLIHKESNGILLPDLKDYTVNGQKLPENKHLLKGVKISDGNKVMPLDFVEFHLPIMVAKNAYNAIEDGATSAGPLYMGTHFEEAFYGLREIGFIDLFKTPYWRNLDYYLLYTWPEDWYNSIGDSYGKLINSVADVRQVVSGLVYTSDNPVMKSVNRWFSKNINGGVDGNIYVNTIPSMVFKNDVEDIPVTPPVMLPSAKLFKDVGWVGMYNQLSNVDERVGMIFISSPDGSHNHSHPHQNSFVIQAYGEYLAIDSDYYDAYHSSFDVNYNKKTYAHNTITYDGGLGQPRATMSANGYISEFLNGSDMILAGGNAKNAYQGKLDKFDRRIIYIKPETFIVIDDLASSGGKKSWEWWLNAYGDIKVYDDNSGAQVNYNNVNLDVKFHYPDKLEPNYIDYFAGPDLVEVAPPTKQNNARYPFNPSEAPDKRIYFATEEKEATKIITTLDVSKEKNGRKYVKSEQIGNVMKLSFEDGTICYIKTDDSETMSIDYFETNADAIVERDETYMMVSGTYLKYGEQILIESDVECSVMFGDGELSVSSIDKDANIKIYAPSVNKLTRIVDEKATEIKENTEYGVFKYVKEEDYLNFRLYPGQLYFYLNDKPLPGAQTDISLTTDIDGTISSYLLKGTIDQNESIYAEKKIDGIDGIYLYKDSKGIQLDAKPGNIKVFEDYNFKFISDNAYLKLEKVVDKGVKVDKYKNYLEHFDLASVKLNAVSFDSVKGTHSELKWNREIDGKTYTGTTLQNLNDTEETVTYILDVPEDGNYDIVIGYSTVSGVNVERVYNLNGNVSKFILPATDLYSDLDQVRLRTNVYLKKGKNELSLMAITSGSSIYDWVGLIKSEL